MMARQPRPQQHCESVAYTLEGFCRRGPGDIARVQRALE